MKTANQCKDLHDVREAIDSIDKEIITLLGERMSYVLTASLFKPTEQSIKAPDRVVAMLEDRRQWAKEASLDSNFIVPLYAQIIQWYIIKQTEFWLENNSNLQLLGVNHS